MKKNLKYLIIGFLILIVTFLVCYLVFKYQTQKNILNQIAKNKATAGENIMPIVNVVDASVITPEERQSLKISSDLNIEILQRDASGTPMAYKILNVQDVANQVKANIAIASDLKAEDGLSLMSDEEKRSLKLDHLGVYEIISRGANGNITSYRFLYFNEPETIKIEFMDSQEEALRGVPANTKIQILEKNNAGEPVVYKIIKNDSDIVKKY